MNNCDPSIGQLFLVQSMKYSVIAFKYGFVGHNFNSYGLKRVISFQVLIPFSLPYR